MTGYIDVKVRLYLSCDVDKKEAKEIVDRMEYSFEDDLIDTTEIYHYETE